MPGPGSSHRVRSRMALVQGGDTECIVWEIFPIKLGATPRNILMAAK